MKEKMMIFIVICSFSLFVMSVIKFFNTPAPKEVVKVVQACNNQEVARKTVIQEAKDVCKGKWSGTLKNTSETDFEAPCNQ